MNTLISFEIAVLLKQKEFELPTIYYYDSFGDKCSGNSKTNWNNSQELLCSAPTLSEVVMWLYEKHEIWIEVSCHTVLDEKDDDIDVFYFIIRELKPVNILYSGDFVNAPTEAYEAGINHCLTNLI